MFELTNSVVWTCISTVQNDQILRQLPAPGTSFYSWDPQDSGSYWVYNTMQHGTLKCTRFSQWLLFKWQLFVGFSHKMIKFSSEVSEKHTSSGKLNWFRWMLNEIQSPYRWKQYVHLKCRHEPSIYMAGKPKKPHLFLGKDSGSWWKLVTAVRQTKNYRNFSQEKMHKSTAVQCGVTRYKLV